MAGVNKVILVGNLGADPEARSFSNGGEVVNLRIATSENWKDRDGKRKEKTEWHSVASSTKTSAASPRAICARARRSTSKASCRPANGRTSRATTVTRPRSCCRNSAVSFSCSTAAKARVVDAARSTRLRRRRFWWRRPGEAAVASPAGGVRHRPGRRRSFLGFVDPFRSLREHRERARLLFRHHAGLLQRGIGFRAARIGIEAERQRVGDGAAKIDRRAVMKDGVAIGRAQLDLFVGPGSGGSGMKMNSNGSSTWAATGSPVTTQLCSSAATNRPSARTISPVSRQRGVRFEPVERPRPKPLGRPRRVRLRRRPGPAVRRRGSGRAGVGARSGRSSESPLGPARRAIPLRSDPRIPSSAPRCGPERRARRRPCRRFRSAASVQSALPAHAARHNPVRRASIPTSLRTVLPSVGSPSPSSRCSLSITSMNRSVSATDAALPCVALRSSRTRTSAMSVASTANRPSSVSGTSPSTYQCGSRALRGDCGEQRRAARPVGR